MTNPLCALEEFIGHVDNSPLKLLTFYYRLNDRVLELDNLILSGEPCYSDKWIRFKRLIFMSLMVGIDAYLKEVEQIDISRTND